MGRRQRPMTPERLIAKGREAARRLGATDGLRSSVAIWALSDLRAGRTRSCSTAHAQRCYDAARRAMMEHVEPRDPPMHSIVADVIGDEFIGGETWEDEFVNDIKGRI